MKQSLLVFIISVFLLTSFSVFSQIPSKINFQAILRNTSGEIISSKAVGVKMSIKSGTINGNSLYVETHTKTTDVSGLITIQMGTGAVISGIFGDIEWGSGSHFIQLEVDFNGGSNYVVIGTQELISVPYALYANKTDTSVLNLRNRFSEKVNVGDTSNMLRNYVTGLNGKVNISDTSNMLNNYLTGLNQKVNIIDTATMLNSYFKKSDTTSLNLTNRFNEKLNVTDFPRGTTTGNIMFFNGTSWVNLAPGSPGQSLIISSNGLPTWGCIITNTAGSPSSSPSLVVNTALTPITISTTGAIGIGAATGLPTGVTASWSNNVITISGTPTATGSFTYTIPLTGGCGSVNATGTIMVTVFSCGTNSVSDIDVNTYNTVSIGNQCWMSENLKTSRYNNGDLIPIVTDNGTWSNLRNDKTGGRTWYNNDSATYENPYGNLYNAYVITDSRGLCPTGWHVPSEAEWNTLISFLGAGAGGKMKSTTTGTIYWNTTNTGATNSSGFTGLPGGFRNLNGTFNHINNYAFFWSSTVHIADVYLWTKHLPYNGDYVINSWDYGYNGNITAGCSVRCLKD
jgi:uncharacterized protein (TIGR02145 family)